MILKIVQMKLISLELHSCKIFMLYKHLLDTMQSLIYKHILIRRLTNDDSDAVIFESESCSVKNGTSETDDTAEGSYRSKRFTVELSAASFMKEENNSPEPMSCPREIQYMYIQMEFCEKSTLR